MGLRWELGTLQAGVADTAKPYLKAQAGSLTVAKSGGDAMDSHPLALGVVAVGGRFKDSFLEVGVGRSEVFATKSSPRLRVNALLSLSPEGWEERPAAVEISVDSDLGSGPDSIRTYLGIDLDVGRLFGGGVGNAAAKQPN